MQNGVTDDVCHEIGDLQTRMVVRWLEPQPALENAG
jgi:hypothetical protein